MNFFTDKGAPDECWIWWGYINRGGYGRLLHKETDGRMKTLAHRTSWEMANDEKIPDGWVVRHTCDTPACVNPAHLEIGTHADNVQDQIERGRHWTQQKKCVSS